MDLNSLIQLKRKRFEQLERDIADPALFSNRRRASEMMREHANIKQVLAKWDELEVARKQLDDNRELATSRDVEIAAMADDEIPELEKRVADLERDVQIALLPSDETEERDAIVTLRAGPAHSDGYDGALSGRPQPDQKQRKSDIDLASAVAGAKPARRGGEIQRATPGPNRHGWTRRKNSHLQFSAEPHHGSPHRPDAS